MLKSIFIVFSSIIFIGCQAQAPTQTPSPAPIEESISPNEAQTTYSFTTSDEGITAYDLLSQNVDLETKDFGDAGLFVESINGLAGDDSHYWGFYINGEYAQTGISQTVLQTGDTIELKYETLDSSEFNQ
jgi:hypothetical protein